MDILRKSALFGYAEPFAAYLSDHPQYTAALCGTALVGFGTLYHVIRSRGLPPGPRGWPVIGNSSLLAGSLVETMDMLRKKYGDVVCLWLGGNRHWVILNGYETIKEAYVERGDDFMDRQLGPIWQHIDFKDGVFSERFNETYKSNRKFCTQALRTSGFAKDGQERRLAVEWQELCTAFDECPSSGIEQEKHFRWAMSNIICGVLFDRQLPHGDKDLDQMAMAAYTFLDTVMAGEAIQFLPEWLTKWFHTESDTWKKAKEATESMTSLIEEIVLEHQKTFDEHNIRDFLDTCLQHGILEKKGLRHMAHVCLVFMPDATYTTCSMMMFIIMYLIHYPQFQSRMRKEASDLCANGVSLSMREKMPFTEAFISEVFRMVSPIATSVPNRPLQATTFRGYRIPKDYDIMVNIHGVHHDPVTYPEPEKFKPERFLEKGKLKRYEQFFPFGIGRRRCMGEQLVRSQLFYYTANMVLRYEVCAVDGELPDTTPQETSLAKSHLPFNCVFKKL